MPNRVVFFIEGQTVPSSRFRILQYISKCKELDCDVKVCTTRPNKYLWYPAWSKGLPVLYLPLAFISVVWIVLQRLLQILIFGMRSDVVVLQRDLLYRVPFPFLEAILFWIAPAKTRFIFDVDDAIYLDKQGRHDRLQERKLRFICRNCDAVIAGNSHLAEYFERLTKVIVVPTTIDTQRFSPAEIDDGKENSLVVGWTGVKSNLAAIEAIVPALMTIKKEIPFRLMIITDRDAVFSAALMELGAEHVHWNKATEVEDLRRIDIGIMPLADNEWSRGKCGFKLLQYMSVGIPCIASAVGVNSDIVIEGENGFLARNMHEWSSGLRQFLLDSSRRAEMGRSGRSTVVERYSVAKWGDSFVAAVVGSGGLK